jgi:cell division cycle 2-like protein
MGIKRAYPVPADADFAGDVRCDAPKLTILKRTRLWSSDDYEETRQLGQGAYGGGVEARLRYTGATFAVKNPLPSPHVEFRPFSRDAVAGKLSFVMDCVGPTLHDVLHERRGGRPFAEAEVRLIMRQLLGGARHIYRRGVVHRDIKPENILVGGGGIEDVKLCDMGLAVSMRERPPYGKRGTYRYMAPEVLLGQTDYDAMVDMWSLGCVMAELLTGESLFDADGDAETLLAIFRVLGVPLFTTWPAYDSLPLAGKLATPPRVITRNKLREHFPEDLLSKEGFEVLKGLLSCNIDKRLSATTALRRPWFTNAGDDAPA